MLNFFSRKKRADPDNLTGVAELVACKMADLAASAIPAGTPLLSLSDKPLSHQEFGSASGLLPAVLWHANRIAAYGMDRKSGLDPAFRTDRAALLGYRVELTPNSIPESEILLFMIEAIHQTFGGLDRCPSNGHTVRLDGLVAEFVSAMSLEHPGPVVGARPSART